MKKLIFLLALLLIAMPVMANDVVVEVNAPDDPIEMAWDQEELEVPVVISYDANGEGEIRAFALNIEIPEGAENWGAERNEGAGYNITPTNVSVEDGEIGDYGDVTVGGIDIAEEPSITIEMGSLYESGDTPPGDACDLLTVYIGVFDAGEYCITVSENDTRGGIVMASPVTEATLKAIGDCFTVTRGAPPPCFEVNDIDRSGRVITQDMVDLWESLGSPCCWCYDCHPLGDTDGDCDVDNGDLGVAIVGYNFATYAQGLCADTDYDGDVDNGDLGNFIVGYQFDSCNLYLEGDCNSVPPEPCDVEPCDYEDPNEMCGYCVPGIGTP